MVLKGGIQGENQESGRSHREATGKAAAVWFSMDMPHPIRDGASLAAQLVKNPPAIRETWVPFLGWDDLLETGMATHSSILA